MELLKCWQPEALNRGPDCDGVSRGDLGANHVPVNARFVKMEWLGVAGL